METEEKRTAKAFVVYYSHLPGRLCMVPQRNFLRADLLIYLKIKTALVKFEAAVHEEVEDGGQCRG